MPWGVAAAAVGAAGSIYSANKASKAQQGSALSQTNNIDPNIQRASNYALDRATELSKRQYTPFTGSRVAGLSANEQQAGRLASQYGTALSDQIRAGGPTKEQLSAFSNPYLDQVLGNQRRVIGEEYGRQSANLAANQAAMDAFRSGRSDLARSRLDANRMTALSDAEAQGRAGAFDRAMAGYFNNQNAQRGAFESSEQALGQTGLQSRAVNQAGLDVNYGNFLERRDWDVNNLGPLMNAVSAARGGSTSSGTKTLMPGTPDYWGAAAGLISSGINAYGNYKNQSPSPQAPAPANTDFYGSQNGAFGNYVGPTAPGAMLPWEG